MKADKDIVLAFSEEDTRVLRILVTTKTVRVPHPVDYGLGFVLRDYRFSGETDNDGREVWRA